MGKLFKLIIMCFMTLTLSSQTPEEVRSFINRSHIAVAKAQKEVYRSKKSDLSDDVKQAIKYQMISIKLFKENKLESAVGYSYKARIQSISTCGKLGIDIKEFDSNETFVITSTLPPVELNWSDYKKIESLDIMDVQSFLELELSIK